MGSKREFMLSSLTGELYALLSAAGSAAGQLLIGTAEKKLSVFTINITKTSIALLCLSLMRWAVAGTALPLGIPKPAWIFLTLSGMIGYVFGDMLYFGSYRYLGVRIAMVVMSASPLITAWLAYLVFGQTMRAMDFAAVVVVVLGVCMVLLGSGRTQVVGKRKYFRGILFALLGAMGQSGGVIFSMLGMSHIAAAGSALIAAQIRLIGALACYLAFFLFSQNRERLAVDIQQRSAMCFLALGAVCGCFIGVTSALESLRYVSAGVSAAICSVSPVMVLPFSAWILHEKIRFVEVAGSLLCVAGVGFFVL